MSSNKNTGKEKFTTTKSDYTVTTPVNVLGLIHMYLKKAIVYI